MKVHVLQHVSYEDIGSMAPWCAARGADVTYTRFHAGDTRPEIDDPIDLLVVLGGPMSVNDESTLPWLAPEKTFIRNAIDDGTPLIGVCLGAQLIASSLGGRVYRAPEREIGWLPIHAVQNDSGFAFPQTQTVFQWHGETFDLPPGAVHLARSEACENQAFRIDRHVIGLQYHLEMTPSSVRNLITHCGDDLAPAPYVKSRENLLAEPEASYARCHAIMDDILTFLTS